MNKLKTLFICCLVANLLSEVQCMDKKLTNDEQPVIPRLSSFEENQEEYVFKRPSCQETTGKDDLFLGMNKLLKPNQLRPGDKIAVVTLSWGGPGSFLYRYEIGEQRLKDLFGLDVVPTKHALKDPDWIYRNPKARAQDLMEAFLDPSIKAIFSSIGGDESIRILPYIDFNIINQNPKIFLGYSDTTVTHFICLKAGLGSFYGPAIMTAFAENFEMHAYSIQGIKRVLFSNEVIGELDQNKEGWTKEFLDWSTPSNQNIKRKLNIALEWNFIGSFEKPVQGRLIGGCVEVMQFINGTSIWPHLDMWKDSILFLETSEEGITPDALIRFLRNLAAQGILEKLKGILFSKPGGPQISADHFVEYDKAILKAFAEYSIPEIPIVTNMDFGHTDPMWTLPYGCLMEIDPIHRRVFLLESGTC